MDSIKLDEVDAAIVSKLRVAFEQSQNELKMAQEIVSARTNKILELNGALNGIAFLLSGGKNAKFNADYTEVVVFPEVKQ